MKKIQNKKVLIGVLIIIFIIIAIIIWVVNQRRVNSIVIDVDNINSYNIRISMAPAYSTIIYGTTESKIKLNASVFPSKKLNKKISWITSDNCASINDENYITVTSDCEFKVYAKKGNIKSNVLNFKILN